MLARTISVGSTAFLVGAAFTLLARDAFFGNGPVSVSLQVLGFALAGWARLTFGIRSFRFAANPTQGALVTTGPYRYIRNPIYAAAWLIVWSGVAAHWSPMNATLAAVVAVMLIVKIACEEPLLRMVYPEYAEYSRKTARLVPFVV
jgi:protein-S-isoprenylcysteine O-methyltransferase Ste14